MDLAKHTDTGEMLRQLQVRPVERSEEARYQELMARHHYLGALPKIGETIWYVATWHEHWVALIGVSAAALKCGVRDVSSAGIFASSMTASS